MSNQDELNGAIRLIRKGDKATAQKTLLGLLQADRNSELAWLWMAACLDSPEEKRVCFGEVLRINPVNNVARRELDGLGPAVERKPALSPREAAQRNERFKRLTGEGGPSRPAAPGPARRLAPPPALELPAGAPEPAVVSPAPEAAAQPSEIADWLSLSEPSPDSPSFSTIPAALPKKRKRARPAQVTENAKSQEHKQRAVAAAAKAPPLLPPWALPAMLALLFFGIIFWFMLVFANRDPSGSLRLGAPAGGQTQELKVEYLVTGSAGQTKVSYYNAGNKIETWNIARLPYRKTLTVSADSPPRLLVTVENLTRGGEIHCEIKVNDVSRTTNVSTAPKGFITCSALP